jgi:hypothetical protein
MSNPTVSEHNISTVPNPNKKKEENSAITVIPTMAQNRLTTL